MDKDGEGSWAAARARIDTERAMMEDPNRAKVMKRAYVLWEQAGMFEKEPDPEPSYRAPYLGGPWETPATMFDLALEQKQQKDGEQCIQPHESEKREQAIAGRHVGREALRGAKQAIHEPWLPADLGRIPGGPHGRHHD